MANTVAYIHLDNLKHNIEAIARFAKGCKILPAVKADAYGHGAVRLAAYMSELGIDSFAVATIEEAVSLKQAGIGGDIVILSLMVPDDVYVAVEQGFCLFCSDIEYIRLAEEAAKRLSITARVNLEIDTGMGRSGCMPDEAVSIAEYIDSSRYLSLYGISTHFPVSELEDDAYTLGQIKTFYGIADKIKKRGIDTGILHLANTGAIINYPQSTADMIRPGISLYGYLPDPSLAKKLSLKPVMELVSKVLLVKKVKKGTSISYGRRWTADKDTCIATVGAGYADGYSRLLTGKSTVSIRGRRYPVVGTICMDQFMVDLGLHTDVKRYDDVILFGPQGPDAQEIAELMGTIPYEVTCSVSSRVKRIYVD